MAKKNCVYQPVDSCFFSESRPSDALGNSELGSIFPPSVKTLLGALRSSIGEQWHQTHGTTWSMFNDLKELHKVIGNGDDLGPLSCQGPFISFNEQRYFPAPANLMYKKNQAQDLVFFMLELDETPIECDIGKIRLPAFPTKVAGLDDLAGAKPAEGYWISSEGYTKLLNGQIPKSKDLIQLKSLIHEDPRLGIGLDYARSAVTEGLLYQTRHLRLDKQLKIELEVFGLPNEDVLALENKQLIRLGGEGRLAELTLTNSRELPKTQTNQNKVMIYLLTPFACQLDLPTGIPAGFNKKVVDNCEVWEGYINGILMRIWSVASGKVLREGGWNLATHQSRAVESYVPAGAVLFAEIIDESGFQNAIQALHGKTINTSQSTSAEDPYGRGLMLIGNWL